MVYFGGFFAKLGHFAGFSLYVPIPLISPFIYIPLPSVCLDFGDISSNSDLYIINMHGAVPRSSFRVRHSTMQRSSEGCSVGQKGAA